MSLSHVEFLQAVQLLGLRPDGNFTVADVKMKHRALTANWHPDQYNANAELSGTAAAHMKLLNVARDDLLAWLADGKPPWRKERRQSAPPGSPPPGSARSGPEQPGPRPGATPPPGGKEKLEPGRCFKREFGSWPIIHRLQSGQGYELSARHSSPATLFAAETGSYVVGWIVFGLLLLLGKDMLLAAIIAGLLAIPISRFLLRDLLKTNLRIVFTQGHLRWSMPGLVRFHVKPEDQPEFLRRRHLLAEQEELLDQDRRRRGRSPAPRLYRDASQVLVDIGPFRHTSVPVAAILKDPLEELGRLLHAAIRFVHEKDVEETVDRNAAKVPAAPEPPWWVEDWNERIQSVLLRRKGIVLLTAPCVVALVLSINFGLIKLFGPEATFFPSEVALQSQNITPLDWTMISGPCFSRRNTFGRGQTTGECTRITELVNAQSHQVIQCQYGPIRNDGKGYINYIAWAKMVPVDVPSYAIPADQHPFSIIGKAAINVCPRTMSEMRSVFTAGRLVQADWAPWGPR